VNDEHPGSGQSILSGQKEVASVVNALMTSPSWHDSVFFLAYDEGGGPYDHVPPVPHHSNDNTDLYVGSTAVSNIPDISTIAVDSDAYNPCLAPDGTPSLHCDLVSNDPGAQPTDAAATYGFAAQLGFRVPNMVISPFVRKHYVSHNPMDHTAILKFVENRFIGPNAHLTQRDAVQPNLLDFFDFTDKPWQTPPTPPAPVTPASLGYDPCTPQTFAP
jgi:phospholipase C